MIRKVVQDTANTGTQAVDVYLANWHVSPISRLWNTHQQTHSSTQDKIDSSKAENTTKRGKSVLLKKPQSIKQAIDFEDIHKV